MAALAASDVVYSQVSKEIGESGYRKFVMTIAFGDGALTYPAGGIPLDAGKMGCPSSIRVVDLFSPASADGYVYKYDQANNKIRIYQGDNNAVADAPLIELLTSEAPVAAALYAEIQGY